MSSHPLALILAGAAATAVISAGATMAHGPDLIAGLEARADAARIAAGGKSIATRFVTPGGWLTRHPVLSGGNSLPPGVRQRVATAIAAVPGIGGAHWDTGQQRRGGGRSAPPPTPLHCQQDVEGILHARTIRFAEASAAIEPASEPVLDEVADALRPCLGSIIAITGHTDALGSEAANMKLSQRRAAAVQQALVRRSIPADGLRASGVGSQQPVEGLDPGDAANRRIEFSVISIMPLQPTPIDTPGPG